MAHPPPPRSSRTTVFRPIPPARQAGSQTHSIRPTTRSASVFWLLTLAIAVACQTDGGGIDVVETGLVPAGAVNPEDLLVVDCLLPGQVRKLGRSQVYMTPRRPVKTSATECEIRGGEYTAYDRADYRTALRVWKGQAEQGDPQAQNYVGEIYEKGLGTEPDFALAAEWYRRAAKQGHGAAMMNLGQLYEFGRGVDRDLDQALTWYRKASGLDVAGLPYQVAAVGGGASGAPPEELLARAGAPPSIQMIEPPILETRGLHVVAHSAAGGARAGGQERTLIGRVKAPAGLVALVVNDVEQSVDDEGIFRAKVKVAEDGSEVVIAAVDRQGRRAERRMRLELAETARSTSSRPVESRRTPVRDRIEFGTYHALVIGNEDYRDLPRLETARGDAEAVANVLRERYGFRVKLLLDATRYDILSTLNMLRAQLTEKDNLLVYYAGHGELDKVNMRGQWLPVDAERDSTANWISNVAITDILNSMNARHVLVVSDSCYSGALTRSALATLDAGMSDESRTAWLQAMASKRSRTALTSGGLAPVLDSGGGGHSVFARAFLDVLRKNDDVLEGQRLFQELSARVTFAAQSFRFEQLPQYAPIKYAGHEAGDFFLVPRG